MKTKEEETYSVSLVYIKDEFRPASNTQTIALQVLITTATSEEEALGKTVRYYDKEMIGYGLKNKVVIKINNKPLPNPPKINAE